MDGSASVGQRSIEAVLREAPGSSFSGYANSIQGSSILKIAGDIRELQGRGEAVLNLTVGDFRSDQFPIPTKLRQNIQAALEEGQTNYPPSVGVPELRSALQAHLQEDFGLDYPAESFLVAAGARPLLYTGYMALVDPGDLVAYAAPSWNNHHYVRLSGAEGAVLPVSAETNFHPTLAHLEPHLRRARLLVLNSPLNPTGTCIDPDTLREICSAILEENHRRRAAGERPFYVMYDQVYHSLRFGGAEHCTPVGLVPEMAPYSLLLDAVSKGFSGTGLRVGWAAGAPDLIKKMASLTGHYGAWAPRAEQIALARYLSDRTEVAGYRKWMLGEVETRLGLIADELRAMESDGLPVEHIDPQGAIYLSVCFRLRGHEVDGRRIESNEDIRQALLAGAGFAVVPFEAFGLEGAAGDGWMRVSVGAVSADEIREGMARVRALLESAESRR